VHEAFFWGLHLGIFLVWIPAVLISRRSVGSVNRPDFWKVILKGAPGWMRYTLYGLFGYAILNFALFMAQAPSSGNKTGGNPPAIVWRGFSGHWMVFYGAALAIFYSAILRSRNNTRDGVPYLNRCSHCGKWPAECHCFTLK